MSTAEQIIDRTPEVTAFHEHAFWTGEHASQRSGWLKSRRAMLSASDFAAVLGEDKHRSALDVYVDKVMGRPEEKLALDDPRLWGSVLEQPILRTVADFYGWEYRAGGALLVSRAHPLIGATLDAEIDRGDGWIPFEGKTTRVPKGWDEDSGELPTRVLIQAQAQMLVTGAPVNVVFALLQGSRPCQVEVHASAEFHAVLVETAEAFMRRVRELDPPPASLVKSDRDALTRLYPRIEGEFKAIELPAEAVEWTREYMELGRQIRELERRRDHLSDLLRAAIGSARWGVLPCEVESKRVWRLQTEKRAAYTVEASEFPKLLCMKGIKS